MRKERIQQAKDLIGVQLGAEMVEEIVILNFNYLATRFPGATPDEVWTIMDTLFKIDTDPNTQEGSE